MHDYNKNRLQVTTIMESYSQIDSESKVNKVNKVI